ncbi:ODA4, partial [Symbiodinium sp. KB8]
GLLATPWRPQNAPPTPVRVALFLLTFAPRSALMTEWLDGDQRTLVVFGDKVGIDTKLPKRLPKGRTIYFLKQRAAPVDKDAPASSVTINDMGADPLLHLERLVRDVFLPLAANPANQVGWGEVVSREVLDRMHGFLANIAITVGHTKGETTLPLPPIEAGAAAATLTIKDKVHLLEGAVVTWTKQIKRVLKMDPEAPLKRGEHPTPDVELDFWRTKASALNTVFRQLNSERVRRVLQFLDEAHSTYCTPFAKLCREVFAAREEANDNVKYLRTLDSWVSKLNDGVNFDELDSVFKPLMHVILLIWKNSGHYNTPARLVVLVREICNAVIKQALAFVNGKVVFEAISDDEETEAIRLLTKTIEVCGLLKSVYSSYKATANAECPDRPWRIQNAALFVRLDAFIERCHDVLEMTQIVVKFKKLAKVDVGGTKGAVLTHAVKDPGGIHPDFMAAVETFQAVPYDILNIDEDRFDDDYYDFRCTVKELERRLSSVLTQAFEDQDTVIGQFKVLETFEALLDRPTIQDELERKHIAMVQGYGEDLKRVQEIFLTQREAPPIAHNLPPIAGALTWCRGLKERISVPMAKIRELGRALMDREEAKEVAKVHTTIMASLEDFEQAKIEEWGSDLEASSESKLRLPLLVRGSDEATTELEGRLLHVNFDPALVRLLREVKYFLLLDLEVPESAFNIYKSAKQFRTQTAALDLMVQMYNQMLNEMLPVEAPLLKQQLAKIDALLVKGLREITWKSSGINTFIADTQALVREAHKSLFDLKTNLDAIAAILQQWSAEPLLQRKAKAQSPTEFENMYKAARTARFAEIKAQGIEVEKRLKESHGFVSVSKQHPFWVAYTDFVNGIVVQGLSKMVVNSLESLANELDPEFIRRRNQQPMLVLRLDLVDGKGAVFDPAVEEDAVVDARHQSIFSIVNGWVDSFYQAAAQVRRLDSSEGRYVREMMSDMYVQGLLAQINERLFESSEDCDALRQRYRRFAEFWESDMRQRFEEFRSSATVRHKIRKQESGADADGEDGEDADEAVTPAPPASAAAGGAAQESKDADDEDEADPNVTVLELPNLDLFDAKISEFEALQKEVLGMDGRTDIGWVRINSEPIKLAINACLTRWAACYTEYLAQFAVDKLTQLQEFMKVTNEGLSESVPESSDYAEPLERVMTHIRAVVVTAGERAALFGPLKRIIALLKHHGYSVEDLAVGKEKAVEYLEEAHIKWEDTRGRAFTKKEEIFALQKERTVQVKETTEAFFQSVRSFRNEFRKKAPFNFEGAPDEAYAMLDDYHERLVTLQAGADQLNALEDLFELDVSRFTEFRDTLKELRLLHKLWDLKSMVSLTYESWEQMLWSEANTDDLQTQNGKLSDFQTKTLAERDPIIKAWGVYKQIEDQIKNMKLTLPLIAQLHSDALRKRHWTRLAEICGVKSLDPEDPSFTLEEVFKLGLHRHGTDVEDVVDTAGKQSKIEKKLSAIEANWASAVIGFAKHKDDSDVMLIRPSEELLEMLENDTMELQTVKGMGKYAEFFQDKVTIWDTNMQEMDEVLKIWGNVTKAWSDLEVIFMESEDIQMSLPDDTKRFSGIDSAFKELMKQAVETPNAIETCTREGRKDALREMHEGLELCQKSLKDYLDMKKKKFPRFYFMSYKALLTALSNGSNPPKVVPFLGDCYDAIKSLSFLPASEEGAVQNVADSMTAKDGEVVEFRTPFEISGPVENWLNDLTAKQQDTLKEILYDAQEAAVQWDVGEGKPRHLWLDDYPAQVALAATQIFWTEETERSLDDFEGGQDDAVKKYLSLCNDRLNALIERVLGKLDKALRIKIITIITIDVHARDVVQNLIDQKASSADSFMWAQQLRFYWRPENRDVDIKITDFRTKYTYEWIGNTGRLVITPLTDRCYITLTMALRLMLGGAPAGPAGTGKTETTKDLARALALPCYVFNCSDQMNYQGLADIFKGLSQVGAWGCFDEFNRILIEVLSVVATQVKSILDAIKLYSKVENRPEEYQDGPAGSPPVVVGTFSLNGDEVTLIPTCGMFITMNPGYAGRTELPENLKALFRSCAMIRPDLALICENMLMSEGFKNARPLAIKFVTLYQLSSELLSPQKHYDWGLRSVKSVLRVAGALKRAEPEKVEDAVLMRALRDFNTPKMPNADLPIFRRLVQDLFPEFYTIPPKFDSDVESGAMQASKDAGLQPDSDFVKKVVQFQELLDVRHSVMLLGPGGCGKTEVWRMLAGHHNLKAESRSKRPCICEVVNPKAVTGDELYGYMTLAKDWKDGCLSIIMRGMSQNNRDLGFHEYQTNKWVVLDGDIDAVWIESMNTVMDDNKVLTLVSNERVGLTPAMRMVFEINSLANATPATVSRAGILYINETDIGWRPLVDSWLDRRESSHEQAHLRSFFDKYIEPLHDATRKTLAFATPMLIINKAMSVCRFLESGLEGLPANPPAEVLEAVFVEAVMWSFGGSLVVEKQNGARGDHRKTFNEILQGMCSPVKFPKAYGDVESALCFDFYFDKKALEFRPWLDRVESFVPVAIGTGPDETTFGQLSVETVDSVRITTLMDQLVQKGHPVMLIGTAGTGKTSIVQTYLRDRIPEGFCSKVINMNFYMDSEALQALIDSSLDKRGAKGVGPPSGSSKMVFFVDDINLPYKEEYGTQNSLELLRQVMGHKQYYDRADLGLRKDVSDVQVVAAMNPTAGSFTINERLQRFFTVFSCLMPSATDLKIIYTSILAGHARTFSAPVRELTSAIVDASIALHTQVADAFLPSATTFVYNWNMRELSNIFQGLCSARSDFYPKPLTFVRLWAHECRRVFCDRMVEEDVDKFEQRLVKVVGDFFKDMPSEEVFEEPLMFTSFAGLPSSEPVYIQLPPGERGMTMLAKTLADKLAEYNENHAVMDLVLFEAAMEHVARISRIIQNPNGHAMLIGVGGSGKQSLTRLAASICEYSTVQLSVTSKFTLVDLEEALKLLYKAAGAKNEGTIFLMTDTQIVNDKFLVYINEMLTSGWISGLFERDEIDGMLDAVRSEAKAAGVIDEPDSLMEFLRSRVARNLHLVLCFSPVGESFRIRARRFPGLINCTAINRFFDWPEDALQSVAKRFLEDVDLSSPEISANVAEHMASVHLAVTEKSVSFLEKARRRNYVTPKSFLSLIAFYSHLLQEKRELSGKNIKRLADGLSTLQKTSDDVDELKKDLEHTMENVAEQVANTQELLKQVEEEQAKASVEEAKAQAIAARAAEEKASAEKIKGNADTELAAAEPAMIAAAKAVDNLDKDAINTLKALPKPPPAVADVTNAVLIMVYKEKDKNLNWKRAKKMMNNPTSFVAELLEFAKPPEEGEGVQGIDDDTVRRIEKYTADDAVEAGFNPEAMKKSSSAASNLCEFVISCYKYNRIYVKVKPLVDQAAVATEQLNAAMAEKQAADDIVAALRAKLAKLQETLDEATAKREAAEAEAAAGRQKLALADRLVNGLESEQKRWTATVERLKHSELMLIGDVLLSAAFVSYIGAFDYQFRGELWEETWLPDIRARSIPVSDEADPLSQLTDEGKTARMQSEGLPSDRISTENGAIITSSQRWPLMIDPQLQGIKWLRERERDNNLKVIQLSASKWLNDVTSAITNGWTIIVENCDEDLDATLDPVLARAVVARGRSLFLNIGGEEVEYDPAFRLYLQTKLSNPHYKPEIQAQCTMINFIATEVGLQDQLLAQAVNKEKPELEERKQELAALFNKYKVQLLDLEDDLLNRLANAPDDILSDIALIEGLEATKAAATEIEAAVEAGKKTELDINLNREKYIPVAAEGAMLYFMITQLNAINHMYQYSLDSFMLYFFKAIREAPASDTVEERVASLRTTLRLAIYTWVSRGLFEDHKLVLLSQLTFQLMARKKLGDDVEFIPHYFKFLVSPSRRMGEARPGVVAEWLDEPSWNAVQGLAALEGDEFARLPSDLEEASGRFREWYNHVTPETEKLPLDWSALDKEPFKKLLVLRCMRPDRLTVAMNSFVEQTLPAGRDFTECDGTLSSLQVLDATFKDSLPNTPIYFILSPGADVVADLDQMAVTYGFPKGEKYHNVSMGQGQEKIAEEKLALAHKQGHWVILNNVHLMPRWLTRLEKILDTFALDNEGRGSHEDFRLFLTSEPAAGIPIGILNRSIKLTNEPPTGLKANLKRAFCSFKPELINDIDSKQRSILFGLCHFHAIMIERKKFGPIGFNMMYPFSLGDLRDSSVCLANYMENASGKIPWEDLRYIFGQIMYGGHIVNDFDRLLCVTYLEFYMRDELLDEMELFPFNRDEKDATFMSPSPTTYDRYVEHISTGIKGDTPIAFGLHPNAEIGFRTDRSEQFFLLLQELQPRDAAATEGASSPRDVARTMVENIMTQFGDTTYDLEEIAASMDDGSGSRGPFQNVLVLELEQMDRLLRAMRRSLEDLTLGFDGRLTMSDAMDTLENSLFLGRVPAPWAALAWPSLRTLDMWCTDLARRIEQLNEWRDNPMEIPRVTWISGFINPQSFLTAIRQQTAQKTGEELDKLAIQTDVQKKFAEEVDAPSSDGAYITGLFIVGARWDVTAGMVDKSRPREMFCPMPVVDARSVKADKLELKGYHECPVYKTEQRGPTFVFVAQLRSKSPPSRWIMAGVALIMDVGI